MILQYCSDLHLEFPENRKFLSDNPLKPGGDVLLLAGDIVPFAAMDRHRDFFDFVSDNFSATYWIPGNHEYYHSDASRRSGSFQENIRSNVHLVNNKVVELDSITVILSTLWTKISVPMQRSIERGMYDFHAITHKGRAFTSREYNGLHTECLNFLKPALTNIKTEKSVVVTHHIPTEFNYPKQYRGSVLTEAFAVELSPFIEASGPDTWIFGHHHSNLPDFVIGKTTLTTNQLGYVKYNEHSGYQPSRCLAY